MLSDLMDPRANSVHVFPAAERQAFLRYINDALEGDADLARVLPLDLDSVDGLCAVVRDGVLLCKLINAAVPETIPLHHLTLDFERDPKARTFHVLENQRMCLLGAKAIGCQLVNISSEDLAEGKATLVFGLLWQIIRAGLLFHINLKEHPELMRLFQKGEDMRNVPAETLLLRWCNWHLERAGYSGRPVANFSADFIDSVAYVHLLHALDPAVAPRDDVRMVMQETDLLVRANRMLDMAERVDTSSRTFLRAEDVVEGRDKLNLCFLANLFNKCTGMAALHEELEAKNAALEHLVSEERARTVDMASLVGELRARIAHLEMENGELKERLLQRECDFEEMTVEKAAVKEEMHAAACMWRAADEERARTIATLESTVAMLHKELAATRTDLEKERMQVETFGLCADSLSGELEGFRSRQEKMEYLLEHLKVERLRSDRHVNRLRRLYKNFPSTEALCRAIYCPPPFGSDSGGKDAQRLTLDRILHGGDTEPDMCGFLTKKDRDNNSWRVRYFVLRDNFLFYWKNDADVRSEARAVIRLDDSIVRYTDNPTKTELEATLLCIEVPDHGHIKDVRSDARSGKLEFYVGGTADDVERWKEAIQKAAAWWTRKSSLNTMQARRRHQRESGSSRKSSDANTLLASLKTLGGTSPVYASPLAQHVESEGFPMEPSAPLPPPLENVTAQLVGPGSGSSPDTNVSDCGGSGGGGMAPGAGTLLSGSLGSR